MTMHVRNGQRTATTPSSPETGLLCGLLRALCIIENGQPQEIIFLFSFLFLATFPDINFHDALNDADDPSIIQKDTRKFPF